MCPFLLLNDLITFRNLIVDRLDLYGEVNLVRVIHQLFVQGLSFRSQLLKFFL